MKIMKYPHEPTPFQQFTIHGYNAVIYKSKCTDLCFDCWY